MRCFSGAHRTADPEYASASPRMLFALLEPNKSTDLEQFFGLVVSAQNGLALLGSPNLVRAICHGVRSRATL
jgi:hypothetical protein